MTIVQFFDPVCQGKMENAGLGKALFRKSHFLRTDAPPAEREPKTDPTQIKSRGWLQRRIGAG